MALWYFAYGSNMSPATFAGRRGMKPIESRCAWIDGYRLCFDIPIGPGERGVANLCLDAAARTHGVAHLLTDEQAAFLDRTEGVPRVYEREVVEITTADGLVAGFTYRSKKMTSEGRKPSGRYLDILLDGARVHGLPAEYVVFLESFDLAFDERIGAVRLDAK
jgi:hypothetical protein